MAKYVKTEQGYVDASIFAPAQFKPEGKSYLTFSSPKNFTLEVNNRTKNWDGILEYFASDKTWTVWDGTTILSGHNNDGEYVLYLRGTGNTKITGMGTNINWIITGTDIKCIGNIENLLDYATVASGKHPTMAKFCYSQMFYGCASLTQAPELPATTLAKSCYFSMFSNCTALTQAPTLPATTLEANCYNNMFYGCTSLTQAPALPATTLTEGCYGGMFSGCTALTQAPALPATTLENACYRSMFQGCTSLKLSSTKTGEYTQEYRIPSSGTGTIHGYALTDMFVSTGGTFTGTPAINTTYYLSTDNMIVRDTEVATLNGYVGSMIDNSVSNPLNITGATVGQIAKITAVDESGNPTAWEAVDDRLPKVSSSDAGNVLGVEQIGEHEYGYALTHMPTLNDFIPLGITNASPGQFAKVSFVDDFGGPTAWEAADIYEKPTSGIPKTDLADDVQTSLAKADTAISLGLTAATPGQIIKVKTVQDGKPTEWEAVDLDAGKLTKFTKLLTHTITEDELAASPIAFVWGTAQIPNLNDFNVFVLTIVRPDGTKIEFNKWVRLKINGTLLGNMCGTETAASPQYAITANRLFGFWISGSYYDPSNISVPVLVSPGSSSTFQSGLPDSEPVTSIGFTSYAADYGLTAGIVVELWGAK